MDALDTSGASLHKRGYRTQAGTAPLSETLAAALIMLTPWRAGRILVDPFCGSGTFPIEAAMMAAGIAPGMSRDFLSQKWNNLIPESLWCDCREEAQELIIPEPETVIQGYDIDGRVIAVAHCAVEPSEKIRFSYHESALRRTA